MEDFDKIKPVIKACLANAECLVNAAKDVHKPGQNHIAFHLAAMALEEVGKASMVAVSSLRQNPSVDMADADSEERRPVDWIEDHERKLFWALWLPTFGTMRISADQVRQCQEIARGIHNLRLATLYVNPEDPEATKRVSDHDLDTLFSLTTARLEMEKLTDFRKLDETRQLSVDWFFRAVENPQLKMMVFSGNSLAKLAELGGDAFKWVTWLRETVDEMNRTSKELVEKELCRPNPGGEERNEPKWQIKIRFKSWSHSIRNKPIVEWNKRSEWIKFFPAKDKKELLIQFTLQKKIVVAAVWNAGLRVSWLLAVSLNVGAFGFFWWYGPSFVSRYYEEIVDLQNKAAILLERTPPLEISWGRRALNISDLSNVETMFAHLLHINQSQNQAYDRYFRVLGLLAKNDMFGEFHHTLLAEFYEVFRAAIAAYGDWDGTPATFEAATEKIFQGLGEDFASDMKQVLQLASEVNVEKQSVKAVSLEDVGKMKTYCDTYFLIRAKQEIQERARKERLIPRGAGDKE